MKKLASLLSSSALSALALTADSSDEDALAAIDQLVSSNSETEAALASVRTRLSLGGDADTETVLASIDTAREGGEPDPAKFVPVSALKEVNDQLAEIREEKVLASVEAAIEGGKLTPGQKDWALSLGKKDLPALQSFINDAPVFEGGKPRVAGKPAGEKGKLTEDEAAICSQLGISEADFVKTRDQEEVG